eukprot:m.28912 g.28912  ORF g.28912 m.28912 type:complete len:72 (+) comp9518_c0_seq2:95-310(+)
MMYRQGDYVWVEEKQQWEHCPSQQQQPQQQQQQQLKGYEFSAKYQRNVYRQGEYVWLEEKKEWVHDPKGTS